VSPGTYKLVCSFISYTTVISEDVTIGANEVMTFDFKLSSEQIQIEGATIRARAVTNTENALVNMQIKSATSVNGISSREISINGDKNAAASLRRVSGVTVQDGKYIYVRGLGDRYSRTDLNGAMVPSMDPEKNNIQLDLFPASIINNMKVYKTFSPELPANFAGGYVDIQTKKFPEEFLFQFSTSMGYNTQATFNSNFKTYQGGKTDFLGFDDGTRAIPELAQGDIPFRYQNDEKLDNITRSFNKVMEPSTKTAPVNHDFSVALGDKKKLFGKEIGYLLSYTYTHDYRYYENGENGQYTLPSESSPFLQKDMQYTDSRGIDYVLWGFMGSTSMKLNDNSNITLNLIRNQGGTSSSRFQEGWNNYHEVYIQTRSLQYSQRSFSAAQVIGDHKVKNLKSLQINWQLAYSLSKQDEPDLRFFTNIFHIHPNSEDTVFTIDPAKQSVPARYWRFMDEGNYDGKLDLALPYEFAGKDSKLKFGGKFMRKDRDFTERRFDINDNNDSYSGSVTDYLGDDNIGMSIPEYPQKYGVFVSDASQISNSYTAHQNLFAAYLMTDQQLTNKFRAVYGVRMETTDIFLQSADPDNPVGQLISVDFLPAVNLTYKPKKNINLRAAYTRTLARPSFRELAPYASFEFAGDYTLIGNKNLERTLIDNVDLRFEWALKPGELISFDLFYKGFINPIERTFVATAGNDELTFQNADRADVFGLEFEIRKNLDFVHALKDFKVGFNTSIVNSIVSIPSDELNVIKATDPTASSTRTMYGQAPYIVNAYLNYQSKKAKIDARLVFNTSGPKLAIVVKGGTPNVYEAPRNTMDFVFKKSFGSKMTLSFKAKNLLNAAFKKYYTFKGEEYIYSNFTLGRTFSLGFNYSI
jgi:outer membrane receptor protein involved in Fe transport